MVISGWDNLDGTPNTQEELAEFADEFGVSVPVLADIDGEIFDRYVMAQAAFGLEVLLAPGAEVIKGGMMMEEDDIVDALDDQ
jgi:hypothetical protein